MATTRPPYTKLTCPSPTTPTTGARGPRFHTTGDEVPHARDSFARKLEEAQVVPPFHTTTPTTTTSQPEGTTTLPSLQPILIDDNGTPATWILVLSSSKPLTGRTGLQTEGRFSLLELHWRYHYSLVYRNTPPDKDSSHDDMPCWSPLH